jgi:hypothetical protein
VKREEPMLDLRMLLDKVSRKYFEAQCTVISEYSADISADTWRLWRDVNALRADAGLAPLPVDETRMYGAEEETTYNHWSYQDRPRPGGS